MRSTRSRCSDHFIHKAQDNLKLNATSWVGRTYRFTRSQTRGFTCVAMFLFLNRYNWLVVPMAMERGRIIMLLLIFRVRVVKSRYGVAMLAFFSTPFVLSELLRPFSAAPQFLFSSCALITIRGAAVIFLLLLTKWSAL